MQPTSDEEVTLHQFGTRLDGIDYMDRPGMYALIENSHKQIAVIETSMGYFLPGGGVEAGEAEVDALKREIMEETGYQVSAWLKIGEAIEYIKAHTEEKYYRIHSRFYKVRIGAKIGKEIEKDHRLIWLWHEDALQRLTRQSQVWAILMDKSK